MRALVLRIDRTVRHHCVAVTLAWLLIVVAAVPFALHQSRHLTASGFSVPGSQSAKVNATLDREFPEASRSVVAVLLWPGKGATPAALEAGIGRVQRASRHLPGAELPRQAVELAPYAAGLGEPVVLPLKVMVSEDEARNIVRVLRARLGVGKGPVKGVETHLLGEAALWGGLEETAKDQLTRAEAIGFPILFIVLLVIFGSISAALLPLAIGVVALVVTGAIVYLLSLAFGLSLFTMDAASMLGIGVAVDYSLIVLARMRQEIGNGSFDDARRTALVTSGVAVTVSGLTCVAALAGVLFIPIGVLRSMALGAAIIIAVSVLAAITLLPALITLLGSKRVSANLFDRVPRRAPKRSWSWDRWVATVMKRPVIAIVIVGGLLLAICIPAVHLKTNTGVLQQLDAKSETRIGFTEAAQIAGSGILGPADVVLHAPRGVSSTVFERAVKVARTRAQRLPHVRKLGPVETTRDHAYAAFTVVPSVDPESAAAEKLIERLRNALPTAVAASRVYVSVGGAPATQLDEVRSVASSMWKVLIAVLIISLVPLTLLLRSAILPIKAIAMNLLSVGAAYGVLVIVFQWGWFDSLFNYHAPGHVDTLVPPLLLAIVFGLSTDYEVFLLSRIREHWLESGDSRRAIAEGLTASARTITGAAAVIVCVFGVFVATGVPIIKEIGLGASVAIAIDSTLVRLVLVPAIMALLGERSWWLPTPLTRLAAARPPADVSQPVPE
jgi:uncharacterized membrane protein YdfJ with MMPL/SSD domain